jgi:L-lactate dehydrogenase complex protein LldE
MDDQTSCCGFGGAFAVKFPMISTAMGQVKCASALETGADFLVSQRFKLSYAFTRIALAE